MNMDATSREHTKVSSSVPFLNEDTKASTRYPEFGAQSHNYKGILSHLGA